MPKNEKLRERILKVLTKNSDPMSRDEIAKRLGMDPLKLPLLQMQREGTLKRTGVTRNSVYKPSRRDTAAASPKS